MRKHILAMLAAVVITGVTALSMFVVGVNALVNQNGTVVSNSPAATVTQDPGSSTAAYQAQIAQLQDRVNQYQTREQQYQQIIDQDQQKLNQAANEVQMIQQLLAYLQNRGLIQIDNSGRITVTGGSGN
jgi:TolA-binding protein